jgi:glucose-6-phosphate isomerase
MKRFILALLVGGVVFGTVFAAAATLIVDGRVLQAGSDTDLQCDKDASGVQMWYTVVWETDKFVVDKASIGGVNEACNGAWVDVVLTGAGGVSLGEAKIVKAASPPDPKVDFVPNVPVTDVLDVHVAIY